MGMQLRDLLALTSRTALKLKGASDTIAYEYRIGYLTPEVADSAEQARKDGKTTQNLIDQVVGLVVEWDFFDGDDRLPVTPENARRLPTHVLSGFIIQAYRDLNDQGEASAATTSTT